MDTFSALADPTRRSILEILATTGQLSATDIAKRFEVSSPAISQHLKILREARLVGMQKQAQKRIYSITPEPMITMEVWIERLTKVWHERFERLDAVLQEEKEKLVKTRK
jgi:DNA-binding transcriptional ArsR family regulator